MKKKKLDYVDEEGNIMYGYSLEDMKSYNARLDELTRAVRKMMLYFVITIAAIGMWLVIGLTWLVVHIMKNDIVTRVANLCL